MAVCAGKPWKVRTSRCTAALHAGNDVAIVKRLGQEWIDGLVPYEPVHRGDRLECAIGDKDFPVARNYWLARTETDGKKKVAAHPRRANKKRGEER